MSSHSFFKAVIEYRVSNNFRLYLLPEFKKQIDEGLCRETINNISQWVDMVVKLRINYPDNKSFLMTMFVIPPEHYTELSSNPFGSGVNGNINPHDDVFKTALYIDEKTFENYPSYKKLDMLHEISHVVHGAFFNFMPFSEGFAEMLPFYILELEEEVPEHAQLIADMSPDNMLSIEEVKMRGMNPKEETAQHLPIRVRKSYVSLYLIMRGIMQRLTTKNNGDKIAALNELLGQFSEYQDLASKNKLDRNVIWKFVGLHNDESERTLQLEAQAEIKSLLK